MNISFTKAHGAGNDFLLTWADQVLGGDLPAIARAITRFAANGAGEVTIAATFTSLSAFMIAKCDIPIFPRPMMPARIMWAQP